MKSEKIAEAQKLRDEGETYQAIANALGVGRETIRYNLNPEVQEKTRLCSKQYYITHKKEKNVYNKRYRVEHKEETRSYNKQYRADHEEEMHAHDKQYYADHKEEKSIYDKQYNINHREKKCAYNKQYCAEHKEEAREYRQGHKAQINAKNAKRRSLIAEATIGDMDQIREIYRIAREEPKVRCYLCLKLIPMGEREVDHIFPVSKGGPFCPSTLAVVHTKCNRKKSDKTPEEIGVLL